MSGALLAVFLLLDSPTIVVPNEDVRAVAVECDRQTVSREHLTKDDRVAVQVFMRAEGRTEDLSRGVVDGADERHLRAAVFEPSERTAVDLDERSLSTFSEPL